MKINKKDYILITESLLNEATRQQLINKSRGSDEYKDTSKGRNRWDRRTRSRIFSSVADYNKIDMNAFWKEDMLEFGIKIHGETNDYIVTVLFENILKEIQKEVQRNKNKLEFKCVLQALMRVFNSDDVYIHCSCDDFKYRQAYWATKGNYNSGIPQFSNGKSIQNPNDTKGAGCKHVNLVLANLDWIMKIASVINNYIYYCKDNMEYNYGKFIFPKIYGIDYDRAIQMTLYDYDDEGNPIDSLASDESTINLSNAIGRRRTQFKKLPQQSVNPRFTKSKEEEPEEETNELGLKFGEEEPKTKEVIPPEL